MELSCEIIKDLLPLYYDNVCSAESHMLVQEHISRCKDCQEELGKISKEYNYPTLNQEEAKPIQSIATVWKKDKSKSFIKGTLITLIICSLLIGTFIGLTQWRIIPVPADMLEVTDVYQLSDGRIVYHLNIPDDRELHFIKFTTYKDGSYYNTPYRSVIEGKRIMDHGLFNSYNYIDLAQINADQQAHGDGIEITSCYVGPKEDGILIWEKGMELPAASEELEQMLQSSD